MASDPTALDALVARLREDVTTHRSLNLTERDALELLDALAALRTLVAKARETVRVVQAERDILLAQQKELLTERDAAQARVRTLVEAVERFEGIGHVADCDRAIDEANCDTGALACPGSHRACTCGWSDVQDALDALAAPTAPASTPAADE